LFFFVHTAQLHVAMLVLGRELGAGNVTVGTESAVVVREFASALSWSVPNGPDHLAGSRLENVAPMPGVDSRHDTGSSGWLRHTCFTASLMYSVLRREKRGR
jgi:hypothetical protein